ncbi:unnamed protein product [Rotaria sp. Silwood1]|nr:unnamed protein product [Rotaria sp. Silwood1]
MFNIFEDQLIDDIVSQVEQSRISYNLQREEFHNLNTNLQTYLDNIKTIDNDNYHLQEDIQQIRTNYISTLENYLKRLLNDFRQLSQQLTDIHIDRYKYKSRARRIINEREEFKRRINFIANNEKEQIKCLNFLQKKERTVRNELLKLNEQLQHCLKYVENEKQTHQQAMNKVDNLQVQLEQICVERSKTEFEIQTLKEEIKLMQTAKDFLDEERETILATETEANEYLLSRLDESITCIREDFEQLNKTQLKQVENEYKNMLKIVEEHFTTDESTISHQHTNQIERKQLQEEYQHVLQDLTTLNNHNQVLSKQILTMEVEFHSLHDERIQQLISKDNEIQRTKIELQTLKEKLNHLTEYDRNLKFELTLYRGVLESEHRRQQRQKQSSINTSHLRRPTTLQSNNNLMTDNKTTLLTTSSINQSKFNDQQEEVLITRNRTQSEYDTLGEDTNIQIENILSIKPSSSDEKFVSQEILQQQVIESFDQEHEQDRINVNIIPQDIEKSSSSSSTTVLTEDQLIPSFETQQSSSYTLPISSETRKSLTSSIPSVIREDQSVFSPVQQLSVTPTELRSLPIIPSTNQEISPTETTPVLSEVHQLPLVSPQEPQTLFEISKPLTTSTLEEDHQTISEVPQSLSEISSEVPTITSDIQSSPSSPTIPVTTEYQQLTTDIYEPLSTSSHEHQPLSHASTTPITSEYQQLTSDVHEPHTTLSHEHQLSSHISVIPPDIERLSPLPNTQPIVEYQQLDTDLSLWHASSDASIIPFDIQRRPSSPTTSPITEYQQLVSDLHESSSTVSEDREISSEIQIFPSQNVPTTNIDIQENVVPMTIDDYQTTTLVENESNVENQLNKSFNEIDHHEYDQSIHFIESSQIEQYENPLDTKLNESQSLSFSLSDIKQDERQQSFSPTNLNILSDYDNKLELKQDDISEEIQREEEISSSLTDQTQNDYSTDFTSSLIINDDHKNDNEEDKFNPLPTQDINKQLSRNTSLSDIQEVDDLPISQKIEIISDDDDDPSLAVIMQGCNDIFAILHLDSDEIFNLKKSICITLNDGSIYLLPGVEASVNNLTKLFKKKREELLKQSQRRQSITIASVSSVPNIMSTNLATPPVIVDNYSINSSTSNISSDLNQGISPAMTHLLTYEIKSRIVNTVIEWLKQNSEKLSLVNMNFQEDIDFKVELNNSQDGIIIRCKCGTKHAIGQGRGVLVFSNIYRHFKSQKCSMIIEKQRRSESHSTHTTEVNENCSTSMITTNSNLSMSTASTQKELNSVDPPLHSSKRRTDLSSNTSKSKRKRRN